MSERLFAPLLVGNQPKIFDDRRRAGAEFNLRLARNRLDKGAITPAEFEQVVERTIKAVVDDQIACGFERVTDGRIRWDDPVTPFAVAHDGFVIGGLIRFFDNNVYYRRPTISGPVRFVRSAVIDDFRLLRRLTDRPVMPSVCGPFSLARFCIDENYGGRKALYDDCARLVRGELEALAAAGADWVQLDEPFLSVHPDDLGVAVDAINAAISGVGVKTLVYTYFGSLARVADRVWDINAQAIGADCATAPENFDILLRGPHTLGRAFGLVDARSTRMESSDWLQQRLDALADAGAAHWPVCWITPSAALEFLPSKNAIAKMRLIGDAVAQFAPARIEETVDRP